MKTTLVRAAVLSLALVGFGAASVVNKATAEKMNASTLSNVPSAPHCGPYSTCGMD